MTDKQKQPRKQDEGSTTKQPGKGQALPKQNERGKTMQPGKGQAQAAHKQGRSN